MREKGAFDSNERIEWLTARRDAAGIGTIHACQGTVLGTSRAGGPVRGMLLGVALRSSVEVLAEARTRSGVIAVNGWADEGDLRVGDGIMKVVVAGDSRENVFGAPRRLVGIIKKDVATELELHSPGRSDERPATVRDGRGPLCRASGRRGSRPGWDPRGGGRILAGAAAHRGQAASAAFCAVAASVSSAWTFTRAK